MAASDIVKRNLVFNHGIQADRVRVIHEFIPVNEGHGVGTNARIDVRQKHNIPADAGLVCACGSIEPRKGTDLFLHVALRVAKGAIGRPVHFVWVGGGPDQADAMRNQAAAMSLGDIVHFVGHQRDVNSYYAGSDVFLLPSREDPFPLVMLEAALNGKPIVYFRDSGGAAEFVDEDAGFGVPTLDINAMAHRVLDLLSSAELRDRLGMTARNRVLSQHDLRVRATEVTRLILEELGSADSPVGSAASA